MPTEKRKNLILPPALLAITASVFFLDQASKYLISKILSLGESQAVIRGIVYFTLVHNRGAAFGILKNQVFLFIISAVFSILLIYLNLKNSKARHTALSLVALSLILGGALGNLCDRLIFGYVIDFIDLRVWPVFNLADSAISAGAVLLAIQILRKDKR